MTDTILIVEDETAAAEILRDYLQAAGYQAHILSEGMGVCSWVEQNNPALILLDIMLPGKDGITICREIRSSSKVPIIMATARVDEIDRLLGLELGADDYICKPYSPREVVARVKAVLRRSTDNGESTNTPKNIVIDEKGCRVLLEGKDLGLTAVEFYLFCTLQGQPGRIFSRDQLINTIYSDQRTVSLRTVDSHIKKLRLKITRTGTGQDFIHSVYGLGYKFESP